MTLTAAIEEAVDAARGVVDPAPLQQAGELLGRPWRVVVVGRVSVGKSTLINWLAGEERCKVGLGGVTREPVDVALDDRVLVDTPGIDDPDDALITLGPQLDRADAVIWVVDGLQPLTATERRVAELTLPEGGRVDLVIAKADLLEPNERQGVVERVRDKAAPWHPSSQRALDLRAAVRDRLDPGSLGRPRPPGERRLRGVRQLLAATRDAVSALPPAPGLDEVLQAWRTGVRAATDAVGAAITEGAVRHKTDALLALAERSTEPAEAVAELLGSTPAPALPTVEAPERSRLGTVLAGMSGREGARRVLRAEAARWLAEGVVTIQEWAEDHDDLWDAHARRVCLVEALDAVEAALDNGVDR